MSVSPFLAAHLGKPYVDELFYPGFQKKSEWYDYLKGVEGRSTTITGAPDGINNISECAGFWTTENLQSLYVLCWAYCPVVKGSYMIPLTTSAANMARLTFQLKLHVTPRASSHMPQKRFAKGHSASKGWRFLKGYKELLVQIEQFGSADGRHQDYLFLKCEGHPMKGLKSTAQHLHSWWTKILTNEGNVANRKLLEVAESDEHIHERAAENFSSEWKALVKAVGCHPKRATVADVLLALYQHVALVPDAEDEEVHPEAERLAGGNQFCGASLVRHCTAKLERMSSTSSLASTSSSSSGHSRTESIKSALSDASDELQELAVEHGQSPKPGMLYRERHATLGELRGFAFALKQEFEPYRVRLTPV